MGKYGIVLVMTDNIVTSKSTAGSEDKVAKKTAAKKAAAKPKVAKETEIEDTETVKKTISSKKTNNINLIIFESGASYSANGLRFTRQDNIQEVSDEDFAFLLTLENFRQADPLEIEEYLASKEG